MLAAREEIISLVSTRVTEEQRLQVEVEPTREKVRKTLKKLPKSKAPGIDGMTIEVLLACWSFLQIDCLNMILLFWRTDILSWQTIAGVLKLVSKKADKRCLKDCWRPLTMLPIIYKLIAKLIAERFNHFSSALISKQQIGFISGKHILENISLAWMTHGWVVHHNIPMILILLNFEKAFDLVEHAYI